MAGRSLASLYGPRKTTSGGGNGGGGGFDLGFSNLVDMPGNMLTGIWNLGSTAFHDPLKAGSLLGRGLVSGGLNLGSTLTGGLADSYLQDVNKMYGIKTADIAPAWSRQEGLLPSLVTDVSMAAPIAGGIGSAVLRGAEAAAEGAAAAEIAGDAAKAASLTEQATSGFAQAAKLEKFAHPYKAAWHGLIRNPAMAAVDTKLAASGVSGAGAVQDATGSAARTAAQGFHDQIIAPALERQSATAEAAPSTFAPVAAPAAGETTVFHGDNPAEIRGPQDPRWFTENRFHAESQAGPQGKVYATNVPNDTWAALQAPGQEGAQLGSLRSAAAIDAGHVGMGAPAYDLGGATAAPVQAAEEAVAARQAAQEARTGTKVADASYSAAEPAIATEARQSVVEALGTDAAKQSVVEAQQAGRLAQMQKAASEAVNRSPVKKLLYGSATKGEQDLTLGTRIKAGIGERLIAADLRAELNTQRRFAEAARRESLHSVQVQTAITVAKEHILPLVEGDAHAASRIVGDEIASRMNGIRHMQDTYGISDSQAVEMGWRSESLPPELTGNTPEAVAFNQAVDGATSLWVGERAKALETMKSTRLGERGLQGADANIPSLTKDEMRLFNKAQKDLNRAHGEVLAGKIERETLRANKQVAGIDDQIGKMAAALEETKAAHPGIIAEFDSARSGLPALWKDAKNAGKWTAWTHDLFARLTDPAEEFHGFTFDPHAQKIVDAPTPKGRYLVGVLPGVDGIPITELTPQMLDETARFYQNLFDGNPDIMLGGWVDENTGLAYIEPSQIVQTRSEALTLGQSRGQLAAWDLTGSEINTNFGRPDISGRFAGSRKSGSSVVSNHTYRDRYATQLYDAATTTKIDAAGVDQALALNDAIAARWGEVTGQHPDLYYSKMRATSRIKQPTTLTGRLTQTLLAHENPTSDLWHQAEQAGIDIEQARKWYYRSHDAIEKRWRGKTVTLLNGHQIDAADLVYELLAVSSVSAAPLDNLASSLTGLANIREFGAEFGKNQASIERMVKDFIDTSPARATGKAPSLRAESELFQRIGAGTHGMYLTPQYAAFDILSGHTIAPYEGWSGWTTDYLKQQPKLFGGQTRSISEAAATPEAVSAMADMLRPAWTGDEASLVAHARDLVVREHQGSSALAKLLSFHDNLAHPDTSMAVTLDSWMERLFGHQKLWGTTGAYEQYANTMRSIAEDLSARLGEKVMPHEVQAVFWAYAKQEISRQNVGILHAFAADTLDAIDNGTWTPGTDPFNGYMDLEHAPLKAAEESKNVGRDRTWNRGMLKKKVVRKHPEWSAYKVTKEVNRLEDANPEYAATKAKAAEIRTTGGANQVIERQVPVVRAESGSPTPIESARAFAPQTETQRYINTISKADKVKEALLKPELYRAGVQQEMWDAIKAGRPQDASEIFATHVNTVARGVRDEKWGDFSTILANPTGERLPAALDRLSKLGDESPIESLAARFRGEVVGATVMPKDPAGKFLVELYRGADFTTLVHEHAHVLRQMLPEADLKILEQSYGIKSAKGGWTWTRNAEEKFANDFTGYLASGKSKLPLLNEVFTRLRQELGKVWAYVTDAFQHNRMGAAIPDGTRALIDRYLNPDTAELSSTPGFSIKEPPPEVRHLAQEARATPNIPGATPTGMYRSGVTSGRAIEQLRANEFKQSEIIRKAARATKTRDAIKQSIIEGTLPSQLEKQALIGGANKTLERFMGSAENPSLSRVPAHWQPMWKAAKDLVELSKKDPELAAAMEDIPDTFTKLLRSAESAGFNPTHVRSFTPAEVQRLVFQSMRLGKPNARLGEEAAAGTRSARNYTGQRAASIEALAASTHEVVWEARTNAIVDWVDGIARDISPGQKVPDGWSAWEPRRHTLLTDTNLQTGEVTAKTSTKIIPDAVAHTLDNYSKDFNQPLFRAITKVTNPWRAFVLTLSPRWYFNNFFGNAVLATVEGVRLRDWLQAWQSFRKSDVGGQQVRFADIPFITGGSFVSDIGGADTLIGRSPGLAGMKEAQTMGGLRESAKAAQHHLIRANEAVDELARAAVYFKTVRTGGSHAAALEKAFTALVDYHALSPFEQNMVRAVVPFYAWQKGMLKVALKMPFDHPAVVPLMYAMGKVNEQIQQDNFGTQLPKGYKGLIKLPFGAGVINTRGMNPLADASSLSTPEGIASAINPLVGIGLRTGFHAPAFGESQAGISDFGTVQADVNMGKALAGIGTGLPQARLAGAGNAKSYGTGSDVAKFLGLPVMPSEQVQSIVKRTKKSRHALGIPNATIYVSTYSAGKKKQTIKTGTGKVTAASILKMYSK